MQPGETFTPGQAPAPLQPEPPIQPQQQPAAPAPEPRQPDPEPVQAPPPPEQQEPEPAQEAGWKFNPNDNSPGLGEDTPPPAPSVNPVSWTASEYIQHQKNAGWYILAGLSIVVIAAAVYLVTRDITSAIVIGVAGIAFSAFSARPPQVLDYTIDNAGVHIGQKFYPYSNFRSFSVQAEDATRLILLMPTQRIGLPITIYYDPKDEGEIVQALGASLPHEPRQVAVIDKFMRKIRF